jgi:DNA mismatch repair protein MutS
MMRQYFDIKKNHPGMVLFYHLGDFYELFAEDAVEVSALLGLTLTARNGVSMCGFPCHAADGYIARLLKHGKRIAICEQMEDPSQCKGLVRREVTRILTPATVTDEMLITSDDNNFLMAVFFRGGEPASFGKKAAPRAAKRAGEKRKTNTSAGAQEGIALAIVDISTGEFIIASSDKGSIGFLEDALARFNPSEFVILDTQHTQCAHLIQPSVHVKQIETRTFLPCDIAAKQNEQIVEQLMKLQESEDAAFQASALAFAYLRETRLGVLHNVTRIRRLAGSSLLPASTQANLELVRSLNGDDGYTLLSVLDRCRSPMGHRLLRRNVLAPFMDVEIINKRLGLVGALVTDRAHVDMLERHLSGVRDLERIATRIAILRASPRDLITLKLTLMEIRELRKILLEKPEFLELCQNIDSPDEIIDIIARVMSDEPSAYIGDGCVIRPGHSSELDKLRNRLDGSEDALMKMQKRERDRSGIWSLKIRYNRIIGYYIEVSNANLSNVPKDYIHKQTMVGGARYVTDELRKYEGRILGAQTRIAALEEELYMELLKDLEKHLDSIRRLAALIAEVDVIVNFARNALDYNYTRPVVDEGEVLSIVDGRHPVVERSLPEPFVPNSTHLDLSENRILIVTGPNMAGKSTYLRQTALITLMAQIGSWVPAESAQIGIVDSIFTRVGASDRLAYGQSTFLVEMLETASILNNASARSLIIMDEIGRGTSTYDGLSLALSLIEFLINTPHVGGRTLFATHYHEMTVLGKLPGVGNLNVEVREWNDEVIFLRKVVRGVADKSYGIHVARLAGLPPQVITRARQILQELETLDEVRLSPAKHSVSAKESGGGGRQLSLFQAGEEAVLERIRILDPSHLTPMEALHLLAELKENLNAPY